MRTAWLGHPALPAVARGHVPGLAAGPWLAWLLTLLLLAPILLAIWTVPGFITQDGPAHLYNAAILADSFDPQSPYELVYEVRWEPFPNWAGHLALVGLLRFVSPWTADRLMMSATLLGFALALVWLRWRVRGGQGMLGPCLLAAILSANFLWLMGFTSFLLGSCLFPITLGIWWTGRDRAGYVRPAVIMLLLLTQLFLPSGQPGADCAWAGAPGTPGPFADGRGLCPGEPPQTAGTDGDRFLAPRALGLPLPANVEAGRSAPPDLGKPEQRLFHFRMGGSSGLG